MKRIMFNDRFRLTEAVLEEKKTHTRRLFHIPDKMVHLVNDTDKIVICETQHHGDVIEWRNSDDNVRMTFRPEYKVGEVIAVAQSYKNIADTLPPPYRRASDGWIDIDIVSSAGWNNKMFVKASLMPGKIECTRVWAEQLQDITDEDCIKEGIHTLIDKKTRQKSFGVPVSDNEIFWLDWTPRGAYAELIDRICGKGTWEKNPVTWCYEFKLFRN